MSNKVEISLKGGLIQVEKCSPGVSVIVCDYDVEGSTEALDKDNNGKPCFRTVYTHSYSEKKHYNFYKALKKIAFSNKMLTAERWKRKLKELKKMKSIRNLNKR